MDKPPDNWFDTEDGTCLQLHPVRGYDPHWIYCAGCGKFTDEETIGHVFEWQAPDGRLFHANVGSGEAVAEHLGYAVEDCEFRELAAGEPVASIDYCEACATFIQLLTCQRDTNGLH